MARQASRGRDGRYRRRTAIALLALLLPGCGERPSDARFENYLQRLDRTLGVSEPQLPAARPPRPPRPGQLRLDIPPGKLGTLDFLALRGCAVQVTVARRNSSLGLMARASQRLLLELEYLQLAPACVERLRARGRDSLARELEQAWRDKRRQLPALIFNATLASDEYRAFWSAARAPGDYPRVTSSLTTAALAANTERVRRWLGGDYRADGREFELHLGEVAGGDGGALLDALSRQAQWLSRADAMLDRRMDRGPLCAGAIRHRAADILPNVVRKFFVGEIQPRAAILNRRRYELLPPIMALETQLDAVLPPPYRQWMDARNRLIANAAAAPRRHVETVQRILAACKDAGSAVPPRQEAGGKTQ